MSSITAGYARVSTREQSLNRQIARLRPLVTDERYLFSDKASGRSFDRPEYQAMKRILRNGDTLVICSLDRLGREAKTMKTEWNELRERGINLKVLDMPLLNQTDLSDQTQVFIQNIVFETICYLADMEYQAIKERREQGIEIAKAAGKHMGRPKIEKPANWNEVIALVDSGEITSVEACRKMSLKKATYYRMRKSGD